LEVVIVIRWSINLSILLTEHPYLDRFQAAADLGFQAVETWWPPADVDLDAVIRAKERAGVEVALLNADAGDLAAGERGFLGDPTRLDRLYQSAQQAFDLAQALGCPRVHILGGNRVPALTRDQQLALAIEAHQALCAQAAARRLEITLEPQNPRDTPHYLFHTSQATVDYIRQVNHPALRLQYDVYHMQISEGDITHRLKQLMPYISHVQVADVPHRSRPGTGELNYLFIFSVLEQLGYTGCVGLEYRSTPETTAASLCWLPQPLRSTCHAEQLADTLFNVTQA
jgi:hydroxypyruvate isomerase